MGAQAFGRLSHCHMPTGACGAGGGAGASCCHGVGCEGAEVAPSRRTTRVFWDRTLTWMIPSGGGCGSFADTASPPHLTSKGMPGSATFPEPFDAFMALSIT